MWSGHRGMAARNLRMGVLYDFAYFTWKAFSRLMDDFSLTNSDCELLAHEISKMSRDHLLLSFRCGAFRRATPINYNRRLKLYCRRWFPRYTLQDCKCQTYGRENFQVQRFARKFSRLEIVSLSLLLPPAWRKESLSDRQRERTKVSRVQRDMESTSPNRSF